MYTVDVVVRDVVGGSRPAAGWIVEAWLLRASEGLHAACGGRSSPRESVVESVRSRSLCIRQDIVSGLSMEVPKGRVDSTPALLCLVGLGPLQIFCSS